MLVALLHTLIPVAAAAAAVLLAATVTMRPAGNESRLGRPGWRAGPISLRGRGYGVTTLPPKVTTRRPSEAKDQPSAPE